MAVAGILAAMVVPLCYIAFTVCGTFSVYSAARDYRFGNKSRFSETSADCSKNYGTLLFIPRLLKTIQPLDFSYNNLVQIDRDDFFHIAMFFRSLDLLHNSLVFISPGAFQPMKHLNALSLMHNHLTNPALHSVFSIATLKELDLRYCDLDTPPLDIFQRCLMSQLEVLRLHVRDTTELDLSVFAPLHNLRELELAGNQFSRIKPFPLVELATLDLSSNALTLFPESCHWLDNRTSMYPQLTGLVLRDTMIQNLTQHVCLPKLQHLDLSGNKFSVPPSYMFHGEKFPALLQLNLESMKVHKLQISRFAFQNPSLEKLSLMYNYFAFDERLLGEHCFAGCPNLTALLLSTSYVDFMNGDKILQVFGDLTNNRLRSLPSGILDDLSLMKLILSGNLIPTVTESAFSAATWNRLRAINLEENLWKCDSDLLWFQRWFRSKSTLFHNSGRTAYHCLNIIIESTVSEFCLSEQDWKLSAISIAFIDDFSSFLIFLQLILVIYFSCRITKRHNFTDLAPALTSSFPAYLTSSMRRSKLVNPARHAALASSLPLAARRSMFSLNGPVCPTCGSTIDHDVINDVREEPGHTFRPVSVRNGGRQPEERDRSRIHQGVLDDRTDNGSDPQCLISPSVTVDHQTRWVGEDMEDSGRSGSSAASEYTALSQASLGCEGSRDGASFDAGGLQTASPSANSRGTHGDRCSRVKSRGKGPVSSVETDRTVTFNSGVYPSDGCSVSFILDIPLTLCAGNTDKPTKPATIQMPDSRSGDSESTGTDGLPSWDGVATPMLQKDFKVIPEPIFSQKWQASAVFSAAGGTLLKSCSEVFLYVPSGAVEEAKEVHVLTAVCTNVDLVSRNLKLLKGEAVCSPLVEYWAGHEFHFKKPVIISLPHFLPRNSDPSLVHVYKIARCHDGQLAVTRLRPKGPQSQRVFTTPNRESTTATKVSSVVAQEEDKDGANSTGQGVSWEEESFFWLSEDDQVVIETDHFCGYVCTYCKQHNFPPNLKVIACGSHRMDQEGRRSAKVTIHVWDKEDQKLEERSIMLRGSPDELRKSTLRLQPIGRDRNLWQHCLESDGRPAFLPEQQCDLNEFLSCDNDECPVVARKMTCPISFDWMLESTSGSQPDRWLQCAVDLCHVLAGQYPSWDTRSVNKRVPLEVPMKTECVNPSFSDAGSANGTVPSGDRNSPGRNSPHSFGHENDLERQCTTAANGLLSSPTSTTREGPATVNYIYMNNQPVHNQNFKIASIQGGETNFATSVASYRSRARDREGILNTFHAEEMPQPQTRPDGEGGSETQELSGN